MLGFSITDPSNSLEWMIFLAKKYSSMFLEGTWLTLYIAVAGAILVSCWAISSVSSRISVSMKATAF